METGLFEIQADHLERKQARRVHPTSREFVYAVLGRTDSSDVGHVSASHGVASDTGDGPSSMGTALGPTNVEFARCFLRLADYALDRLSRYEAILWRQVRQTLIALDGLDRRKPQDRGRYFRIGRYDRPEEDQN